jgi:putative protease
MRKMFFNDIQLAAPAGNKEKLKIALEAGADKIFLGGKLLNMKAGTENFNDEELKEAVNYVHSFGKKLYVTLNAVPQNQELEKLPEYAKYLEIIGVDGVIISDLGVFQCIKTFTKLPITINTHSSNTNWRSVKMWKDLGADTIVLDRDISLASIAEIRAKVPDIKLEVSVHGPINMAISRRPIISNYLAIKGIDIDSTKENITIEEETRPTENMPVYEDKYGTYIYSSRDLCTLNIMEELLMLGINSIKIDGGMKDTYYLSTVVSVYREVLDSFKNGNFKYKEEWMEKLKTTSDKPFIDWFVN